MPHLLCDAPTAYVSCSVRATSFSGIYFIKFDFFTSINGSKNPRKWTWNNLNSMQHNFMLLSNLSIQADGSFAGFYMKNRTNLCKMECLVHIRLPILFLTWQLKRTLSAELEVYIYTGIPLIKYFAIQLWKKFKKKNEGCIQYSCCRKLLLHSVLYDVFYI